MRVLPLLVTTLLLAAPVFGQQKPSPTPNRASVATATADQPPAHPITRAQVHQLYELTGANKIKGQMARAMWMNVKKVFPPYMPKDVMDELGADFENMDLESMQLKIYQRYISAEDAVQIIAFDKTPAGQRMIRIMPQMTGEMLASGEKWGEELTQRVLNEHMDEIKAAAAKYKQEHSDAPIITSPN